jgi:hypothetical protein
MSTVSRSCETTSHVFLVAKALGRAVLQLRGKPRATSHYAQVFGASCVLDRICTHGLPIGQLQAAIFRAERIPSDEALEAALVPQPHSIRREIDHIQHAATAADSPGRAVGENGIGDSEQPYPISRRQRERISFPVLIRSREHDTIRAEPPCCAPSSPNLG